MYRVVQVTRNFDFQSEEGVKVRTAEPPRALDDKGAVKKYTPEELRVLKGKDRSLPGYESSVAALGVGQTVQVTLTAHKKLAASEKDKDRDPDRDPVAERQMQVRMIVIVADAPAGAAQPKKKKKN
jgi:hypothetical protein